MPHSEPLEADDLRQVGAYRLTGRLGVGGQGVVYLGEPASAPDGGDTDLVAVKLLHSDWLRDPTALGRLSKEVAAARRVASFCTARVVDADLDARPPYVVSEYIEGPTLLAHVSDGGPLTGSRLLRLAVGTATALTAIHQHGVVHRDFKPGNIILGPDGPRVIDFGIAREQSMDASGTTGVVGTPVYMAPEHFVGKPIGPSADVFAWASTMVYAATGQGPFTAPTLAAIMNRVINDEPTIGDLPEPLSGLVHHCLTKDPSARPTSRDALLALLADTETTVPRDTPIFAAASPAAQTPFAPPPPGEAPAAATTAPAAPPGGAAFPAPGPGPGGVGDAVGRGLAASPDGGPSSPDVGAPAAGAAGGAHPFFGASAPAPGASPGAAGMSGHPPANAGSTWPEGRSGVGPGAGDGFEDGHAGMAPRPPGAPGGAASPGGAPHDAPHYGPVGPGGAAAPGGMPAGGATGPGGPPYGDTGGPGGPPPGGGAYGGPPPGGGGGPSGAGTPPGRGRKKMLLAVAGGVGALVVLVGVALFAFGRPWDSAEAANGSPQAQASPSAQPGARNVDVTGKQGNSTKRGKAGQRRAGKNAKGKAHGKNPHRAGEKAKRGRHHAGAKNSSAPTSTPRTHTPPKPRPNRYTPGQACGSGYRVLESHPMFKGGYRVATVYLMYDNGSGNNCTVTMRSDQGVGKRRVHVGATLQRRGGRVQSDSGQFLWYGGPVRLHAPGTCVRYGGSFGSVSFTSPYGHCG